MWIWRECKVSAKKCRYVVWYHSYWVAVVALRLLVLSKRLGVSFPSAGELSVELTYLVLTKGAMILIWVLTVATKGDEKLVWTMCVHTLQCTRTWAFASILCLGDLVCRQELATGRKQLKHGLYVYLILTLWKEAVPQDVPYYHHPNSGVPHHVSMSSALSASK